MSEALATTADAPDLWLPDFEELEKLELIYDDGEPLESNQHRIQMNLAIDLIEQVMAERGHEDYFAGGNMFVYYSLEQARFVATHPPDAYRHYRGPDVFFVDGVAPKGDRKAWVAWNEGGRYPDVILELLSPSTAQIDRTTKKKIYAETLRTAEYYLYEPGAAQFEGFHLTNSGYQPLDPDENGRLRSAKLGLWVGLWQGRHKRIDSTWLRLYDADGRLVPTQEEIASAAVERAEAAEAEAARLRERLSERSSS